MKREQGYYWVKYKNDTNETPIHHLVYWNGGMWFDKGCSIDDDLIIDETPVVYKPKSKLTVSLQDYGYHCGDGCCYDYGTITKVNGKEMECHNQDIDTILEMVLTELGYDVEIIREEDDND
jgi:hypothetical protein